MAIFVSRYWSPRIFDPRIESAQIGANGGDTLDSTEKDIPSFAYHLGFDCWRP